MVSPENLLTSSRIALDERFESFASGSVRRRSATSMTRPVGTNLSDLVSALHF